MKRWAALFVALIVPSFTFSQQRESANLDGSITVRPEFSTDDFKSPTKIQSAELALHKLGEANAALKSMSPKDECAEGSVPVLRNGQEHMVAVCMLTEEEFTNFKKNVGKEIVTWEVSTGNDADPKLLGTRVTIDSKTGDVPMQKGYSDDEGRTFDAEVKRRATNDDGYSELRFKTQAFGQRDRTPLPAGSASTSANTGPTRPRMKLFNITSLTLEKGEKLPGEDFGVTDFRVNEGSIEVSTGKAKSLLGTELQTWFHETSKSGPIYDYVDHDKTRVRAVLKTGLQRLVEGDLGKFRCRMVATGLVGLGTDGKPLAEARLAAGINSGSLGGRSKDNPWIQLDGYRKHLIRPGTRAETETGIRVTTSAEIFGSVVKPFIGVARHDGPLDRKYAAGSKFGSKDLYYTVGVSVQWK